MSEKKTPIPERDFLRFSASFVRADLTQALYKKPETFGLERGSKTEIEILIADTLEKCFPRWDEFKKEEAERRKFYQ